MSKHLTLYSKNNCGYCLQAKSFLDLHGVAYHEHNIEIDPAAREFVMSQGHRTLPQIYLDNKLFVTGGWQGLSKLSHDELHGLLNNFDNLDLGSL